MDLPPRRIDTLLDHGRLRRARTRFVRQPSARFRHGRQAAVRGTPSQRRGAVHGRQWRVVRSCRASLSRVAARSRGRVRRFIKVMNGCGSRRLPIASILSAVPIQEGVSRSANTRELRQHGGGGVFESRSFAGPPPAARLLAALHRLCQVDGRQDQPNVRHLAPTVNQDRYGRRRSHGKSSGRARTHTTAPPAVPHYFASERERAFDYGAPPCWSYPAR